MKYYSKIFRLLAILFIISCSKKIETFDTLSKVEKDFYQRCKYLIGKDSLNGALNILDLQESYLEVDNKNLICKFNIELPESLDISASGIRFDPIVNFKLQKKVPNKILLKFDEKLIPDTIYRLKFDIKKLFPILKDINVHEVDTAFKSYPLMIDIFKDELIPEQTRKTLTYKAYLKMTEEIDLEKLKESINIKYGKITLKPEIKKRGVLDFDIICSNILRDSTKSKTLTIIIDNNILDLKNKFKKTSLVHPLSSLSFLKIGKKDKGKVTLLFSENLDKNQNLAGLVNVIPKIENFKMNTYKNKLFIYGNFRKGQKYKIFLERGIKSYWKTEMKKSVDVKIDIPHEKPRVEFVSKGVYLSSSNAQKIHFKAVNLKKVHLKVFKIFNKNIGFLSEGMWSYRKKDNRLYLGEVYNNGICIFDEEKILSQKTNEWGTYSLDMKDIFEKHKDGIFLVRLSIKKDYIDYPKNDSHEYESDYYENPNNRGYYYRHGNNNKIVILNDLGLTLKKSLSDDFNGKYTVFVTDIKDQSPRDNVLVKFYGPQKQILFSGKTDKQGKIEYKHVLDNTKMGLSLKSVQYVEASFGDSRSFLFLQNDMWKYSGFQVGGITTSQNDMKAYIYQDRGVYRPQDEINLSLIVRNNQKGFPDHHNIDMTIKNPMMKKVEFQSNNKGKDGLYSFNYKIPANAITGTWSAYFKIGSQVIFHDFKVETVVPYRLKVKLNAESKSSQKDHKNINLKLKSQYLSGNVSSNHDAKIDVRYEAKKFTTPKYKQYIFNREDVLFNDYRESIYRGKLNDKGELFVKYDLPNFKSPPSELQAIFKGTVYEKGGRPVDNYYRHIIKPYKNYVGIRNLKDSKYFKSGDSVPLKIVLVDEEGKTVSNHRLEYKVYTNDSYWWWEADNYQEFKLNFKRDYIARVVDEGIVMSKKAPIDFSFDIDDNGSYFIEVTDLDSKIKHSSSFFIQSSYYASDYGQNNEDVADILQITKDKTKYAVGDTAIISFLTPSNKNWNSLISLSKNSKILWNKWHKPNEKNKGITHVKIPITKNMKPNCYASVSLLQSHDFVKNDRPVRMYGIVNLDIEERNVSKTIDIIAPDVIKSGEEFKIKVQSATNRKTQFTIAVVDEGLLDLTNFQTPDPYHFFNLKEKYGVFDYDNYDKILKKFRFPIDGNFSIGGGYGMAQSSKNKKRFHFVSFFKGPLETDEKGFAEVKFKMKDYTGSVRVMVIAASKDYLAKGEVTIPVKTDIMLESSLPRFLRIGDEFILNLNALQGNENIKKGKISLSCDDKFLIKNKDNYKIDFSKKAENEFQFNVKALNNLGFGNFNFNVNSGNYKRKKQISVDIKSLSEEVTNVQDKVLNKGEEVNFDIISSYPRLETNTSITISKIPDLNLQSKLRWLIGYPYGCIEQTTSKVFPQLFLRDLLMQGNDLRLELDRNIEKGISRLRRFQQMNGGMSYWIGGNNSNPWGSNYALHYFIEAKKKGYVVDQYVYDALLTYVRDTSLKNIEHNKYASIYSIYLQSLAQKPNIEAMNFIRENYLKNLNNTQKWLLAASYSLAGYQKISFEIVNKVSIDVSPYKFAGNTFGSALRDRSLILLASLDLDNKFISKKLFTSISSEISNERIYSTQTTSFALLAIYKYIEKFFPSENENIILMIETGDKKKRKIILDKIFTTIDLTRKHNGKISIKYDFERDIELFTSLVWTGVPSKLEDKSEHRSLKHDINYYDENGMLIIPNNLEKGKSFWVEIITYGVKGLALGNVVLDFSLPACWEVDNERLHSNVYPNWIKQKNPAVYEYRDIKDDKIYWSFAQYPSQRRFYIKLNAVTKGTFSRPASIFKSMYDNKFYSILKGDTIKVK